MNWDTGTIEPQYLTAQELEAERKRLDFLVRDLEFRLQAAGWPAYELNSRYVAAVSDLDRVRNEMARRSNREVQ